jgi:hypothetical protein
MDLALHRQTVAHSLTALESSIERLVDALAHRDAWFSVDGARQEREARAQVCAAYSTIDYAMEDQVGSSVVCLGVVGGNGDLIKRAEAVNAAKAAFKAVCTPLQKVRTRVPVKENGGGTKALPVIRVVLRGIQRSDLNLLAAYRKIPILDAPPLSVTYTRARTRAVYRKTIEEIYNLLVNMEGPRASADRAKLATLGKQDQHLAIVRPHYDNVRANIVYARLDSRGRGRVQIAAELPLLYATGRQHTIPEVTFPRTAEDESELPRRNRQAELEPEPFLQTIAAHRYVHSTFATL